MNKNRQKQLANKCKQVEATDKLIKAGWNHWYMGRNKKKQIQKQKEH